jgi:hypothetical protein
MEAPASLLTRGHRCAATGEITLLAVVGKLDQAGVEKAILGRTFAAGEREE